MARNGCPSSFFLRRSPGLLSDLKRKAFCSSSYGGQFRYEVCAHKWMALCEYNRGAALLNDCKYGHSCDGNVMRISLLRSSKSPDDTADMGQHKVCSTFLRDRCKINGQAVLYCPCLYFSLRPQIRGHT